MTPHGPSACPHPGPRACPRTVGHGCTLAHMATNICIYTHTHATVTGSSLIITQLYSSLSPAEYFTCDLARWQGGRGRGRGEGAGACAGQRHRLVPSQGPLTPRLKPQKGRVCKIVTSQVWESIPHRLQLPSAPGSGTEDRSLARAHPPPCKLMGTLLLHPLPASALEASPRHPPA